MARLQSSLQHELASERFVNMNNKLHNEFDDKTEIESIYSYLRLNELLKFYLRCDPHLSGYVVKRYGHTYLRLLSKVLMIFADGSTN